MRIRIIHKLLFILPFLILPAFASGYIHHELHVNLKPAENYISVEDRISFPDSTASGAIYFLLHGNLKMDSSVSGVSLAGDSLHADLFGISAEDFVPPERIPYRLYRINLSENKAEQIVLKYSGKIDHPIEQRSAEYARGFSETPGLITDQGVYLAGSTFWVPWFNDKLVTFDMNVGLPDDWDAVSQGKRAEHKVGTENGMVRWESPDPVDEIYLVAARFTLYERRTSDIQIMAYLRTPDPSLADKYLDATGQYLEMYNKLIGSYPYTKFALVENFWETGYGMPSFTLLGEKIIRFPFIITSSYPHELLHNWWGNGVFVDYNRGNWCEGLTAYMADHLIKEQHGEGVEYRRSALQAYRDYVNQGNEIPLSQFHSRHDAATSAVGYDKSLMLFHMLRRDVGDDLFRKTFQTFYRLNKFKKVGFGEIQEAIESVSGKAFGYFFNQWINRTGAPELSLSDVKVTVESGQYNLTYTLSQVQDGDPFLIRIPIAIYNEGATEVLMKEVELTKKTQNFRLILDKRPLRIQVDPEFDVFRRLDRQEIPPSLSQAFGSRQVLIVLPSAENQVWKDAYRGIAESWAKDDSGKIQIRMDNEVNTLPADRAIWLFGDQNRLRDVMNTGLKDYNAAVDSVQYRFGNESARGSDKSVVVTVRNPEQADEVVVWLKA
jgi:aminopeptidase N